MKHTLALPRQGRISPAHVYRIKNANTTDVLTQLQIPSYKTRDTQSMSPCHRRRLPNRLNADWWPNLLLHGHL